MCRWELVQQCDLDLSDLITGPHGSEPRAQDVLGGRGGQAQCLAAHKVRDLLLSRADCARDRSFRAGQEGQLVAILTDMILSYLKAQRQEASGLPAERVGSSTLPRSRWRVLCSACS